MAKHQAIVNKVNAERISFDGKEAVYMLVDLDGESYAVKAHNIIALEPCYGYVTVYYYN